MNPSQDDTQELTKKFFVKCRDDFPFFARKSLNIRDKEGSVQKLYLNQAQLHIHDRLQKQKQTKGYIRAIILKGRQQGVSTYVQARFLWRLLHSRGLKAFILTHLASATKNLFDMTKRYVKGLPLYKPTLGNSNVNEMQFSGLECGYKVGTAGSQGIGRSDTLQLFHGSEVAFWDNAESHLAGILQTVPDTQGTEIILESTANGTGNIFHTMCMEASIGNNDFELIFVPWTMQSEYAIFEGEDLVLTDEEKIIQDRYKINEGQLRFRRKKVSQLGDVRRFRQEYPFSIQDAFVADTETSFITVTELDKANRPENPIQSDKEGALILGIDPSGKGKDLTAYAFRCGRILAECDTLPKRMDTMEQVGDLAKLIDRISPDKVFVDIGGVGAPIYDRLKERGYRMVQGINFGAKPDDQERYANKRAEMYDRLKRWFNDPPCQIPNSQQLDAELMMMEESLNSSGKLQLSPKKNLAFSPNLADAFALTFAQIITINNYKYNTQVNSSANMDWNPYNL